MFYNFGPSSLGQMVCFDLLIDYLLLAAKKKKKKKKKKGKSKKMAKC
jgi:hypothetical protein